MSRVLKDYTFPRARGRNGGAKEMYPFDEWFDGRAHKLYPNHDFTCTISGMQSCLYRAAEVRGLEVRVSVDREPGRALGVVVQNMGKAKVRA